MKKKIVRILTVLAVVVIIVSPLFIRIKIECKSQLGECPKEITDKLGTLNGKYLIKAKKDVAKILSQDFLISNFSTQLKLPNILVVNVIVKKPKFTIFDKNQNTYFLIDSEGYILSKSQAANLPTIVVENSDFKPGIKVSDQYVFALKLIQGIFQMYQVGIGTIQNDTLVVDLPNGIRVILPLSGYDTQVLLGSLRLIYTKVTTSYVGIYSQIDMRFKNPILR